MKRIKILNLFLWSFISLCYSVILGYVLSKNNIHLPYGYKPKSILEEIIIALIVGPFFETFVFQFIIYYIVRIFESYLKSYFKIVYIFFATLFFAAAHSYSKEFILFMLPPGFLLAIIFFNRQKNYQSPFASVLVVHFLYNLGVFIFNHY